MSIRIPGVRARARRLSPLASGLVLAAFALATRSALLAQPAGAPLPAARDIITRHVQAIGGEAAVRRHSSSHARGTFAIPAAGLTGGLEMFGAAPNKSLVRITLGAVGEVNQGFDGTTAWQIGPDGARTLQGRELSERAEQSDFYGRLFPVSSYKSMETVEQTDFDGKRAYKLRLVSQAGDTAFVYFDVASGLLVGRATDVQTPMGAFQAVTTFSDYKQFGDVSSPTRITSRIGPQETVITLATVDYDQVAPATFAVPAAVKK